MRYLRIALFSFVIAILVHLGLNAAEAGSDPLEGWFKAGSDSAGYEVGTVEYGDDRAAYIRGVNPEPEKFGTLMQSFAPGEYLGERVRLSASIRTEDVEGWVGMWMRVDKGEKSVSFDNMKNRALTGDNDWQEYSIVLDVPEDADNIALGIILSGPGRAEWDAIRLEIVDDSVPPTGMSNRRRAKGPTNLDFEQ